MTDNAKGFGDHMASLGGALTSPAKLAFAGFVILAYQGTISVSLGWFMLIAVAFIVVQVFHDDYFRIVLNRWATTPVRRL
jgi:hypothetical protein